MAKITGDIRARSAFWFAERPTNVSRTTTFAAPLKDERRVTLRVTDLFGLPDETPVLTHQRTQHDINAFAMTVGELKAKAAEHDRKALGEPRIWRAPQ
jgi:hypothetical protein